MSKKKVYFEKEKDWIVRNLQIYDNCLIPSQIVKALGIEEVENRLAEELNKKISVRESTTYLQQTNAGKKKQKPETNYIAEVLRTNG